MTYIEQETIYSKPKIKGKLRIILNSKEVIEYDLADIDWIQTQKELEKK